MTLYQRDTTLGSTHTYSLDIDNEPHPMAQSLPQELLVTIFLLNADVCDTVNQPLPHRDQIAGAVPWAHIAAQVCRNWRAAALSCPFLWTTALLSEFNQPFSRSYGKWLELLLERKKDIPFNSTILYPPIGCDALQIDSDEEEEEVREEGGLVTTEEGRKRRIRDAARIPPGWEILFAHFSQVRELVINLQLSPFELYMIPPTLRNWMKQPAPHLTSLSLFYNVRIPGGDIRFLGHLLINMIPTHTPTLRELHLQNIQLAPFVAKSLTNLTSLRVEFPGRTSYRPKSRTSDWLDILQAMPNLETLELLDWEDDMQRVDPSRPTVYLPNLRIFWLHRSLDSCSDLFTHLSLSRPLSQFSIRCDKMKPGQEYRNVQAYLNRLLSYHSDQSHEYVYIRARLRAVKFNWSDYQSPGELVSLHFCAESEWNVTEYNPPLASVFQNFSNVTKLGLGASEERDPQAIRSLIKPFTKVKRLLTEDLATVLPAFELDCWDRGHRDILLPSLKEVLSDNLTSSICEPTPESAYPLIFSVVRDRRANNYPIDVFEVVQDTSGNTSAEYRKAYKDFCRLLELFSTKTERPLISWSIP